MSTIKIDQFAGLAPSVSPRALGLSAATAHNLFAPTSEFRPLADDATVAFTLTDSNPVTLYKRQRTAANGPFCTEAQGWYSAAGPVSLVKGQIDDDQTERTYFTYDDGADIPRVSDVAIIKPLGVTPPSAAPVVTSTPVFKYTTDEDTAARIAIPLEMKVAIAESATLQGHGAGQPTMASGADSGWLPHGTAVSSGTLPTATLGEFAYCVKMTSDVNGQSLPAASQYLLDPALHGVKLTYLGAAYWAIPVGLQGVGWIIDAALLTGKLQEIEHPDKEFTHADTTGYSGHGATTPQRQAFPDALCASAAAQVQAAYDPAAEPQATYIADITSCQSKVVLAVTQYGQVAAQVSAIKSFYAQAKIQNEFNVAIDWYAARTVLAVQVILNDDAGTWTEASVGTTLKNQIKALFPSTFTVAGIGSNTLLNFFGADGSLSVNGGLVRTAVIALLTAAVTTTFANVNSPTTVVNRVAAEMDNIYTADLVAVVASSTLRAKYPTEFPDIKLTTYQGPSVVQAIADLKAAAARVTNEYLRKNEDWITLIDSLFDAKDGFASKLPAPVSVVYDTRYYVTTMVTTWGEESAPSAPSEVLDQVDTESGSCSVSRPANIMTLGAEYIAGWRIYRSNMGSTTAQFQLVTGRTGETGAVFDASGTFLHFDKTLAAYADTRPGSELQETLATTTWLKPDTRLRGLSELSNGIMLGYYDNVVCASEPYIPYAWPVQYQLTTKYPIVGLGSYGTTAIALTRGGPYLINGSDSSSLSATPMPSTQSCVSPRSIVSVEDGVLYASPDGICLANNSGVQVITQGLFTREDWQKLNLAGLFAACHEGVYYFASLGAATCYGLDFIAKKLVTLDAQGSAFFVDRFADKLYMASGTTLKALFMGAGRRTATYKTGVFNIGQQHPFAWLRVYSDFTSPVTVNWYADGALRRTAVLTSSEPVRLPPGRWLEHQIETTSSARITQLVICGDTTELQQS